MRITIDLSEITKLITDDVAAKMVQDDMEERLENTFIDLTASPPLGTPVDTGAARQGWQLDLPSLEITNSVPYIGRLNQGSSTQAPAGFVENAVDKNFKP